MSAPDETMLRGHPQPGESDGHLALDGERVPPLLVLIGSLLDVLERRAPETRALVGRAS